jgi:hypothetical protein
MMEIVLTTNDNRTVKKNLADYKHCFVIDSRELMSELGYKSGDKIVSPHDFIINTEIERKFLQAIASKKYNKVIYLLYDVNAHVVKNVRDFMNDNYQNKIYLTLFDAFSEHAELHKEFNMVFASK